MANNSGKYPLILDCDTGEDDAIAIVLAIMSGLPLKYIVTCHGNTTLENATRNSSRIVSLLDAADIKVLVGANAPTKPHLWEAPGFTAGADFLGRNGICNIELPQGKFNNVLDFGQNNFIAELAKRIEQEDKVDYIITGPCTNFALLIDYMGEEKIKKHINSLTIMGGAVYVKGSRGAGVKNTSHEKGEKAPDTWAEFNFYCDPYAVKKTLALGLNPIIVTWDACVPFEVPLSYINAMQGTKPGSKFIIDLMQAFMKLYGTANKTDFELCDPLTIMAFMGYGRTRDEKIDIVTEKELFAKSTPSESGFPIKYFYTESKDEVQSIIAEMMKKLEIHVE